MSSDNSSSNRSFRSQAPRARASYRGQAKLNQSDETFNKGYDSSYSMTNSDSSDHTISMKAHSLSEGSGRSTARNNSDSTEYHVDIAKFTELVNSIKPYWNVKVSDLPAPMFDRFAAIKLLIVNAGSTANSMLLFSIIDEAMKDVDLSQLSPETVGMKFIGCTLPSPPGVSVGCGQNCAGAFHRPEELTGITGCEAAVYLFQNGSFITLTYGTGGAEGPVSKAYIYVPKDFIAFNSSAIDALNRIGIKSVRLIHTGDTFSTWSKVSPDFVPIDTLALGYAPTGQPSVQPATQPMSVSLYPESSSSSISPWWWVVLIIFLLILIGVGIYFACRQNMSASASRVEVIGAGDESFDADELHAKQTPNLDEFDYIGGMRPYSRY